MDASLAVAVVALAGTVASGVMTYRASTKATKVTESAEQRQWLSEARSEAREARKEMAAVRREAEALAAKLHGLVMAIHDPGITLPRLRAMVPIGGGINGSYLRDEGQPGA